MLRVQRRAGSVRRGSFAYDSSAESRERVVLCFSHLTIAKQWTVVAVSHANWRTAEVVFALRFNARSFKIDGQADCAKSARLWAVDTGCVKSENAGEITSEYLRALRKSSGAEQHFLEQPVWGRGFWMSLCMRALLL
jgi:hypothetical protein